MYHINANAMKTVNTELCTSAILELNAANRDTKFEAGKFAYHGKQTPCYRDT